MLPEKIIFVGVALNVFCSLWYIRSIFYGGTRPNLVSWFMWMLAPLVGVFLQVKAGAGLSILGTFMAGFGPFLVIIFALFKKNAFWKINSFDLVCGVFSLLALILYVLTKNIALSIIFAILSDGLAAIPTILKSWKNPETETSFTYWGGVLNNILALLIIQNWHFSIYAFSIYLVLVNLTILFCIHHKKIFKSR